jgi:MFS family permease
MMVVGRKEGGLAILASALPIFIISASVRSTDNMFSTTLPLLGEYVFGLGTIYGGVATSVYAAAGLLANYFVNPRLDAALRRKAVIISAGAAPPLALLLSVSGPVTAVLIGICVSFAFGILYPSMIATASLELGGRGESLISLFGMGLSAALVLGPSLESYLLNYGYAEVCVGFAVVSSVAFFASLKTKFTGVPKETPREGRAAKSGIVAGFLCSAVFFIPFQAFIAFLPIYAARVFGVSASLAYSSFIPLFVVSFLSRAYMTARPFGRLGPPVVGSILITTLGLVLMSAAPSFALFLVVMAALGIPHGLTYTLSLIIVARTSTQQERNAAMSKFSAYSNVLNVMVPLSIGGLIQVIGIHYSFLFLLLPSSLVAAVFLRSYSRVLGVDSAVPT